MRAFQQGDLDGLCGVYSIINALRALGIRNSVEEWQETVNAIIEYLYTHKQSTIFLTDGITTPDISRLLRDIIVQQYKINYRKPFHRKADLSLAEFWDTLFEYLQGEENRTAIFSIAGKDYGHWTVASHLSPKRITLHDSYRSRWINRHQCSTTELYTKSTVLIYPTTLFLLENGG